MIIHKRIQLTKLALALSVALAVAPTFAQNTTSAIAGRISGADGKPASGATVSIVHTESGSVSNVTTDAEGRYIARGLRAGGPFTIIITKNGVTEKREGIYTNLAETAAVDAVIGAPMQKVTVTGSAARSEKFSRTTMGATTSIGATELATQASIQRNLQDYARADPRVSQTDKERGEMSVAGQNSRYNSLTIDGVAVNDTFGLEANGSPTSKQPISIEAIQSVQVNVSNYDVTQKGYTGANVNAVTKSGTNTFKGSVYYVYRNDKMAGDRYNATNDSYAPPAPFKEKTKGMTIGGPLVKDKLFFFANIEEFTSSRTAPQFGPWGGTLTNVGITPDMIATAQGIAKNNYGMDIGGTDVPSGVRTTVRDSLLKLDWNINDDHRVMARYSRTSQSEPFFTGLSANALSLNSYWYSQNKSIETIVGQIFSDWTPSFSTELKASKRLYDSVPKNNARLPVVGLSFSGTLPDGSKGNARFLNFGTEQFRQNNVLRTDTKDLYAGANWTLGAHEVKFGTDYSKNTVYNAFLSNVYGNYSFNCSQSLTYEFAAGTIDCTNGTVAAAAVLENFRRGRPSAYQVQVPVAGGSLSNAIAKFDLVNTGAFAQDTWAVTDRLTLSFGLRLDKSSVAQRPFKNDAAQAARVPGKSDPVTGAVLSRDSGGYGLDNTVTIDGKQLWQPRGGFNYKFDTTRATQIRGGAGVFQGAAASVWMSNPFSNPGTATRVVGCGGTFSACIGTPGQFSPNPDAQPVSASATPAANVDFLDPSFAQPSIIKANLAFDHELPWMGMVFSAEYLYTKNKDAIYYEHLNLGDPTRIGPDGRQLYYTPQAYTTACWSATGTLITSGPCVGVRSRALSNPAYNNVLLAKKTDLGRGNVMTVSLNRPSVQGLGWGVSYTYTDATEVSPLNSSQSSSNWAGRAVFNPNEEVAANSGYAVKDRFNANLSWAKKFFGSYNTRFGMFYEGRKGKPYSWTFNNDMNGDGLGGNDLMYIPKAKGSGEVIFYGDTATSTANEDAFWNVVNNNKSLRESAGGVVKRNGDFSPWTNSFDLRITQEIPGVFTGNKGIFSLDFFNFGNLLNKKWGRINEVGFQTNGGQARSGVNYAGMSGGKYVYQLTPTLETIDIRQAKGESQWAIQATAKYEF